LYPGVVVEEPKMPMTPGSGLCAGFTITKAILSDALALVRGDRFYTADYTPIHLTSYGFREASNDPSIAGGGVLYKLLMRAFRKLCSSSCNSLKPDISKLASTVRTRHMRYTLSQCHPR
jgi:hypothetical protein